MICVKFAAFCNLRADLRIRLATLRKSVRKFCFCKPALTCVDLRVRLARTVEEKSCLSKDFSSYDSEDASVVNEN